MKYLSLWHLRTTGTSSLLLWLPSYSSKSFMRDDFATLRSSQQSRIHSLYSQLSKGLRQTSNFNQTLVTDKTQSGYMLLTGREKAKLKTITKPKHD